MQTDNLKKASAAFRTLFGSYKRSIAILIVLGLLGGILESLGVSILVPLFAHMLQQPLPGSGLITDIFQWFFDVTGLEMRMRVLLPLIIIAFALRGFVQWLFEYVRTYIVTDYERNMQRDLYKLLLSADWPFLAKQKLGHAETEMMLGINNTTKLLSSIAAWILTATSLIAYVAVALTLSVEMTLATLIVGALALYGFKPFLARMRYYGNDLVALGKEVAHDINESVLGLKSIKATAREQALSAHMLKSFEEFRLLRIKQSINGAIAKSAIQPLSVIFVAVAFAYAFNRPGFDLASFIIVIFLIQRIFLYVDRFQSILTDINQQLPYAGSVIHFMRALRENKEVHRGTGSFRFDKAIDFKEVSFGYPGRDQVLKGVNLTIRKGDTVGIIGPSGAGKTTIADLLLRLLRPTAGVIQVDDKPLEDIKLLEWRSHVAYVSQDFFLLNDTVLNNVRFYDDSVSEEAAEQALRTVGLAEVIAKLPKGTRTLVGERGVELSAGQRQRIALARALAREPDVLILDEATSALDGESERAIHEALQALHGIMTMIIIAHRLSTVMEADKIIALDGGVIAEEGSPQELLNNPDSYFSRLTRMQSEGYASSNT